MDTNLFFRIIDELEGKDLKNFNFVIYGRTYAFDIEDEEVGDYDENHQRQEIAFLTELNNQGEIIHRFPFGATGIVERLFHWDVGYYYTHKWTTWFKMYNGLIPKEIIPANIEITWEQKLT